MTLTVKKDDSFPFRNGLGIQGGPEFTVSDQGTRMGTVGKGNMKFSSTESLDAHLTNYVKRNASATTRDGSPYPAKIEVHQILNKE